MGPSVTESLEKDTLGHAGTAEQTVIYSELLEKLGAHRGAETTAEQAEAERHQGHCSMTD